YGQWPEASTHTCASTCISQGLTCDSLSLVRDGEMKRMVKGVLYKEGSESDWWVQKVDLMGVNDGRWKCVMVGFGKHGLGRSMGLVKISNDKVTCAYTGLAAVGEHLRLAVPCVGDLLLAQLTAYGLRLTGAS
ncbi:hypothetical protein HAX54_000602, partial [Datura stramonium]|nr:hypothetical protein [Datura stramonium]